MAGVTVGSDVKGVTVGSDVEGVTVGSDVEGVTVGSDGRCDSGSDKETHEWLGHATQEVGVGDPHTDTGWWGGYAAVWCGCPSAGVAAVGEPREGTGRGPVGSRWLPAAPLADELSVASVP